MDSHQQDLLQSTHDSTIRQEGILNAVQERLSRGDAILVRHSERLDLLEEEAKQAKADRTALINRNSRNTKIAVGVLGLVVTTTAPTIWERVSKWLGW